MDIKNIIIKNANLLGVKSSEPNFNSVVTKATEHFSKSVHRHNFNLNSKNGIRTFKKILGRYGWAQRYFRKAELDKQESYGECSAMITYVVKKTQKDANTKTIDLQLLSPYELAIMVNCSTTHAWNVLNQLIPGLTFKEPRTAGKRSIVVSAIRKSIDKTKAALEFNKIFEKYLKPLHRYLNRNRSTPKFKEPFSPAATSTPVASGSSEHYFSEDDWRDLDL